MADPLGFPTGVTYSYPGLTPVYFDRPDVKAALHAPTSVDWTICGGAVFVGPSGMRRLFYLF
jgi:carboxypeptidase D